MEGEETPITDNRSANPTSLGDAIRELPHDTQLAVAIRTRSLHDVEGGLSEEAVMGPDFRNALIHGLGDGNAGDAPSNIVTDNRQNPSEASILTGPTAIDRYGDAGELGSFRSVPRSVQISERQPLMDTTIEEDATFHDPVSTVTGHYNDASEPGVTMRASPGARNNDLSERRRRDILFLFLFTTVVALLILVPYMSRQDATEGGDRSTEVLKCASMLSNENITEESNPIRWNVTRFFIEGSGQLIETSDCQDPDSLFSTIYGLIAMRESLRVTIPTWHSTTYNITSIDGVCDWKRLQCGPVDGLRGKRITWLTFNNAGLSGTLPPEVRLIRTLTFLDTNSNRAISGTIPSELGLLASLNDLFLHQTSLNGTVPSELGRLTSLHRLILYDTSITGTLPKELCDLPGLKLKTDIPCSRFAFSDKGVA